MYRFLVLVWNPRDSSTSVAAEALSTGQLARKNAWSCVLQVPGVRIYESGARPGISEAVRIEKQGGAVLGTLFRKSSSGNGSRLQSSLNETESHKVVQSMGAHLCDEYWGRYVAVIHDAASGNTTVLRDPSGALPCLYSSYKGVHMFFSDVTDCLHFGSLSFSINWSYIAGLVCSHAQQLRETGLNEVSEVQPGESVELNGDFVRRTFLWHPFRIANSEGIEDATLAVKMFRDVTRDCIYAWASLHQTIVHRLSGGLDSSIVASCLNTAPSKPSVVCLNYFGSGPQEDERRFARMVADRAGFTLVEQPHDPSGVRLDNLLNIAKSERPRFYIYSVEHSEFEAKLAAKEGATALFGGAGGDGLFYQNTATLAAVDYIHRNGLRPRLLKVALDAARIDRLSIWSVAWRALAETLGDTQWDPLSQIGVGRSFVNPAVIAAVRANRNYAHPWLDEAPGIPHGKVWHAMSVSTPLPFYDPLGRPDDAESIYPIMSQPLMEFCLASPTYVLIDSGWDRALARRAFADELPPEIINRRAKGSSTASAKKLFENNIGFIRELLLDGCLVRERLLDKRSLEKYLVPGRSVDGTEFGEILIEHICTEAWLRAWRAEAPTTRVAPSIATRSY